MRQKSRHSERAWPHHPAQGTRAWTEVRAQAHSVSRHSAHEHAHFVLLWLELHHKQLAAIVAGS
jgi:hypothetical protein